MVDTILVTGGYGFIGSNFIRYILRKTQYDVVNLDKKTYAANEMSLSDIEEFMRRLEEGWLESGQEKARIRLVSIQGGIEDERLVSQVLEEYKPTFIVNFAAESHVDNSIKENAYVNFIRSNVTGVACLLEAMKANRNIKRFVQVSTDEVYGSILQGAFNEQSPFNASSIYSATKAAGESIARSYFKTHGLDIVFTRSSNNFGPRQHVEKLIPKAITNLIIGEKIPLMGDGSNVRDWIYVEDNVEAICAVMLKGRAGEVYNIPGGNEKTNKDIVDIILNKSGRDYSWIRTIEHRKGHDFRYAVSGSKIRTGLGWSPKYSGEMMFRQALETTVDWYINNHEWWSPQKMLEASENGEEHIIEALNKYLIVRSHGDGMGRAKKGDSWADELLKK